MILEKFKKVKNHDLLSQYAMNNRYCEYCYHMNTDKKDYMVEIHHIFGGVYRSDELWNVIVLCNPHHSKLHGKSGIYEKSDDNIQLSDLIAIKMLKGEIEPSKILEMLQRTFKNGLNEEIVNIYNRLYNEKKQVKV